MDEKEFEMIALINSSKTLDFEQPAGISKYTLPEFLDDCDFLVTGLGKLSEENIYTAFGELGSMSP
jgi:cytoplasmic iron level regulating protein YaaA (DUF328/UPF0246 family)